MEAEDREEELLLSVALRNAESIRLARQRAEEELLRTKEALERRSEELAHSLAIMSATLESTTDGILVTDGEGRVTGFNARFLEMWGIPNELIGSGEHRQVLGLTSRLLADPGKFLERIEQIHATSPPESYDLLETVDSRSIERFSRIQFVADRNVGRVWSFRDITERRRSEDALREETRVLELLNETGRRLASQLDLRALGQAVTDAARELSGARWGAFFCWTKEDGGGFLLNGVSGSRARFEESGLFREPSLLDKVLPAQAVFRSADITAEPWATRLAALEGGSGAIWGVRSFLHIPVSSRSGGLIGRLILAHPEAGVFTERIERLIAGVASQAAIAIDNAALYEDVKRLAEEREALLEAERAARIEAQRVSLLKDEFLANLSHELRTPLNAILGWSQFVSSGQVGGEGLKQGLETIARNARAQAQLIDDLLDMSRIASGKVRLDVQETELVNVVQQAVNTVWPSAEAKGIRLRQIIDPLIGPVTGDPNRLQQVVWNLLSNAVKFTPRGGRVEVILRRVNSQLEIAVHDSGIGIKPEFLPHVFERFRQADASSSRVHGGLGLGLSIVKQIVEIHGGTVRAQSDGEDKGATFTVTLPLTPVRAQGDRRHSQTPTRDVLEYQGIDLAGMRVLVVEDEADARELIRRVLAQRHAEVLLASGAAEAFPILKTQSPHVVVSDIGMPGVDGYEFMRQVRRLPASDGGEVRAIALTAFARAEDRTQAMMAGYQMHISKPIEPQELVATVANLAGRISKGVEKSR